MKKFTPSTIPVDMLEKYAKSGPRYTSYPTAPQFQTEFDEAEVAGRWRDADRSAGLSVYVHLPFCAHRCLYCACTTEIGHSEEIRAAYVQGLSSELDRIEDLVGGGRELRQLALGGGTPTYLSHDLMRTLVETLKDRFRFPDDREQSLEIDPRHVDAEYLDLLVGLGFNRFSFGVQDFDPTVQKNVRRVSDPEVVADLLSHLRARDRSALNLDIMYGLPGQSEESFAKTLGTLIGLRPSRVAVFGYAHVPWVSPHQKALEKYGVPGPELRTALFGMAYDRLHEAGYAHIGMDHFALPDDELIQALESRTLTRNFMGYTTRRGLDLVGIGASAISSVNTTYTQNVKKVSEYGDRAEGGAWFKALLMSPEDVIRREVIMELFCNFHLDLQALGRRYGVEPDRHFAEELDALGPFQDDGMINLEDGRIEVTDLGRFFIRNICMTFDQYLAGKGRYSKTV